MTYERLEGPDDVSHSSARAPAPPLLTTDGSNASPVVLYSAPDNSHERFDGRRSVILAAIQVAGGLLSIICQSVLTAISSIAMYTGAGFWCGVLYIIAGTFGIVAGRKKGLCQIVTYMVMSIIACVFSVGLMTSLIPALIQDQHEIRYQHTDFKYHSETDHFKADVNPAYKHKVIASYVFNSLLALVLIAELIASIWGSALVCKVTCCAPRTHQAFLAAEVKYVDGQAVIVLGSSPVPIAPEPTGENRIDTSLHQNGGDQKV